MSCLQSNVSHSHNEIVRRELWTTDHVKWQPNALITITGTVALLVTQQALIRQGFALIEHNRCLSCWTKGIFRSKSKYESQKCWKKTARKGIRSYLSLNKDLHNTFSILNPKSYNTSGFTQKTKIYAHKVSYIRTDGAGTGSLRSLAPAWWLLHPQRLTLEKWLTTAPIQSAHTRIKKC